MRQIAGIITIIIITVVNTVILYKCILWHTVKQQSIIDSYIQYECNEYNIHLKEWKRRHGHQWLNKMKTEHPEMFPDDMINIQNIDLLL